VIADGGAGAFEGGARAFLGGVQHLHDLGRVMAEGGGVPKEVSAPKPSTVSSPGFWGGLGHSIASDFDTARHGVAVGADAVNGAATNRFVKDVMNFGNVLPNNGGLMGMINPAKSDPTLEGTVLPRTQTPSPELPQAKPATIQGSVEPQGSVSGSGPRALNQNFADDELRLQNILDDLDFNPDINLNPNLSPSQFSTSSPGFWSWVGSGAENAGKTFAKDFEDVIPELVGALFARTALGGSMSRTMVALLTAAGAIMSALVGLMHGGLDLLLIAGAGIASGLGAYLALMPSKKTILKLCES
jgi:hypothetical protein